MFISSLGASDSIETHFRKTSRCAGLFQENSWMIATIVQWRQPESQPGSTHLCVWRHDEQHEEKKRCFMTRKLKMVHQLNFLESLPHHSSVVISSFYFQHCCLETQMESTGAVFTYLHFLQEPELWSDHVRANVVSWQSFQVSSDEKRFQEES